MESIVNTETHGNSFTSLAESNHEKISCEILLHQASIQYLHKLSRDLMELNSFLDAGVNLSDSVITQLKDHRMGLIEKLEFSLSSLPYVAQTLSVEL
ncbi:hypothetical protein EAY27_27400 [Vibrio anguillarum]|nr:hypothetical protein [Vibrio anguillarum]ASW80998.1 hypothetical protein CK207_07715 [Vibrio anguillarum]AXN05259.1 hypothetical protein DD610_13335 [Vibrio anguillarum]MBF4280806.1 hypothetical protein [Vibrio anguillarum]MBF4286200.1 hypothetical protein [Vibrio anguillarum]MBF4311658.1 hypothetical protein [Vibrio anguillarum]